MRDRLKGLLFGLTTVCLSGMLFVGGTITAKAVDVIPAEEQTKENAGKVWGKQINYVNGLIENNDEITFLPGKTYNLEASMNIPAGKNLKIIATDATIITSKGALSNLNDSNSVGYNKIGGVEIIGGTWKSDKASGGTTSAFKIAHSSNITFKDMDIQNTSVDNHSIELVGCKNVTIDGCTVVGIGNKKGREEQIQIDLASPASAGNLVKGSALNGATCENVTIKNCTVTGNCAIGINSDSPDTKSSGSIKKGQFASKCHKNIKILNNTLVGTKSEGLRAYNVINLQVIGNTVTSTVAPKKAKYLTDACAIHVLNRGPSKKMTCVIKNNKATGQFYGICVHSNGGKIKKATVTGNKAVSKKAKNNKILVTGCKKMTVKNNK